MGESDHFIGTFPRHITAHLLVEIDWVKAKLPLLLGKSFLLLGLFAR